jgi:hypothetical protein
MKKTELIKHIQEVVKKYGEFSTADVEADSIPVIDSLRNTHLLAEVFGEHKVTAVLYVDDNDVDEDFISYEDLSKNVLKEISLLCNQWVLQEEEN